MHLRPPTERDLEAVSAVIAARERADEGPAEHQPADLEGHWRLPGFTLSTDARVAVEGSGAVVGYGEVAHEGSQGVVDPDAEGQGLGRMLLAFVESRGPELGHDVHSQLIASGNRSGASFLSQAGYRIARSYIWMRFDLAGAGADAAVARPGLKLRPLDLDGDAEVVHALDDAAFKAVAGYRPWPLDTFVAEHFHAHDVDAGLSRVAESAGQAVGFALVRRRARAGYVDVLGVHPSSQGAGTGSSLLAAVIAACGAARLEAVELTVASDNPGAMRLYRRTGFLPTHSSDVYEKALESR